MNRQKRFAITGLTVCAAAVAGWLGFQLGSSPPADRRRRRRIRQRPLAPSAPAATTHPAQPDDPFRAGGNDT